ncbi:hypothetical protein [Bacteroides heparinolyticus]|uniref:hypothetical protein n=1 Tax=Prevotella heparinolytica TaxID=28113 RepID=UPI00359F3E0C
MLQIIAINEEKLKAAGFVETPNGFRKEITNCFRFHYDLYILPNDIYGTITGKIRGDESLDYEDWLEKLCFRNEEKREVLTAMLSELEANGAITTAVTV